MTRAWATRHLGVELHHEVSSGDRTVDSIDTLVVPGLRRNPRRAHLLVSTVLGKHVPTEPQVVLSAGDRLGARVAEVLAGQVPMVFGFAETATGLGHCVAVRVGARCYLHSTRRSVPAVAVLTRFEEGHSHATSHQLQPIPAEALRSTAPVVLVDDEISTGNTALDAVRALQAHSPRTRYIVAALVDMRSEADRHRCTALARELGIQLDVVSLAAGHTLVPDGLIDAVATLPEPVFNPVAGRRGSHQRIELPWPATVPEGGRHGFLAADQAEFDAAVTQVAQVLQRQLKRTYPDRPVLVLGHEELMYLPLRVAAALSAAGIPTRFQTTTRSPAQVIDEPGYPLRRGFRFTAPEPGEDAPRYLYNAMWEHTLPVVADAAQVDPARSPVLIVLVDAPADSEHLRAPGGLVDVLTASGADIFLAVLPGADPHALAQRRQASAPTPLHGPDFGSYPAHEVTWLLKDVSDVTLEADTAERERRIQAGLAHYAESLPVEYVPDAQYRELFEQVLADSAERLALAVATVTELVLAERGSDIVLVSLARAGTPIGILMRRWLMQGRAGNSLSVPHYSVSIVRDRGIDRNALSYLARQHDPESVVFVDGWTGKGAIIRELEAALSAYHAGGGARFSADLAVLADPGQCARTFGTRDDFLIASACLNSTVSGLVSRTVLNDELIGPQDFHGAKYYRELAAEDRSNYLIDTVAAAFGKIRDRVPAELAALAATDRTPTWAGWACAEQVRAEYGISSVNFVKPGVGETTRVLLRRVPWRVLVAVPDAAEHAHIRLLAQARGVPVEVVPDLAYSCMGLIKEVST